MTQTHTAGAWELLRQGIELQSHENEQRHWIQAYPPSIEFGTPIADLPISAIHECDGVVYTLSAAESLANGRLMAAAPDLLAALTAVVTDLSQHVFDLGSRIGELQTDPDLIGNAKAQDESFVYQAATAAYRQAAARLDAAKAAIAKATQP